MCTHSFISTKVNGLQPRPARVRAPSAGRFSPANGRTAGGEGAAGRGGTANQDVWKKKLKCGRPEPERALSHTPHETCTSPLEALLCVCVCLCFQIADKTTQSCGGVAASTADNNNKTRTDAKPSVQEGERRVITAHSGNNNKSDE